MSGPAHSPRYWPGATTAHGHAGDSLSDGGRSSNLRTAARDQEGIGVQQFRRLTEHCYGRTMFRLGANVATSSSIAGTLSIGNSGS